MQLHLRQRVQRVGEGRHGRDHQHLLPAQHDGDGAGSVHGPAVSPVAVDPEEPHRLGGSLQGRQVAGPRQLLQLRRRKPARQLSPRGDEERLVQQAHDDPGRHRQPLRHDREVPVVDVPGGDLGLQRVALHPAHQLARVLVGLGSQPGPDVELGGAGEVAGVDQASLLRPQAAHPLVGLQEVGRRGEQHQPLDLVRHRRGDLQGDVAAVRRAHQREPVEPELVEQGQHVLGVGVRRSGCERGAAEPTEVAPHHPVVAGQLGRGQVPHPQVRHPGVQQDDDGARSLVPVMQRHRASLPRAGRGRQPDYLGQGSSASNGSSLPRWDLAAYSRASASR